MFTHSIPTIPWTKCLGLSGETTMTTKSSALTTVSTLLKVTLGALSSPIIAVSGLGALTLYEWQHNPVFRSRITSTYDGAVNLVQANELCHLHGGKPMFFTSPENHVENGITCGFQTREGVQSLLKEYAARNQVVLYSIEPYAKYTTN